jgi:hypothetical protein
MRQDADSWPRCPGMSTPLPRQEFPPLGVDLAINRFAWVNLALW